MVDDEPDGPRPEPTRVVKDMAITHADFFRTLRPLLRELPHEINGDGAILRLGQGRVEIRLGPEGCRALGNVRLPRTRVELCFDGCSRHAVDEFVASFDRRFRRGGG